MCVVSVRRSEVQMAFFLRYRNSLPTVYMHISSHSFTIKFRPTLAASLFCLTSKISGLVMVTSAVGPIQVRMIGW
jgi:hypothetical protein